MSRHHQLIKNDPRWKAARLECFERDDYTCLDCLVSAEDLVDAPLADQLQADHIEELATILDTDPELAYDVDNLATRCGPCNRKRHQDGAGVIRLHWVSPRYREALQTAGVSA